MRGPADVFVMYWEEGRSKSKKPWNRQGGGHIICSGYAEGGRGGVRSLSSVLTNASASEERRHPNPLFYTFPK